MSEALERVQRERDFYRRLLSLGAQPAIEPLLAEALALIVSHAAVRKGYLCLQLADEEQPRWWTAHGCSDEDVEAIRGSISSGIVAAAIAGGETVETGSARHDPRFIDQGSVQRHRIDAVLCVPLLAAGETSLGVLYLQEREQPGPFSADDKQHAEFFAQILAPLADRLLTRRQREEETDPTLPIRRRFRCEELIGRSRALADVLEQASLVAPLNVDVLITGPSGTGKSALARIIALNSARKSGPFVELNCSAIPETLLESELFGSEKGAHTAADRRRDGKVAAAEGGTLFLDEVGELPLGAQAKLLHLLQERRYYPLGATTPRAANIRVLSATNAQLSARIAERTFREDLYHRLNVIRLRMPSLAERREDIGAIAAQLCTASCQQHDLPLIRLSHAARLACEEAAWPGNVRELANALISGVIRAHGEGSELLLPHHLFPDSASAEEGAIGFQEATRRFQRRYLLSALEATGWNIKKTAARLKIARSHMYNLLRAHALKQGD